MEKPTGLYVGNFGDSFDAQLKQRIDAVPLPGLTIMAQVGRGDHIPDPGAMVKMINDQAQRIAKMEIECETLRHGKRLADNRIIEMEQREPAAWLDPDAGKAITAAEKEAADTRQARWQHSYTVPLYR